jgi:hypothetical protein
MEGDVWGVEVEVRRCPDGFVVEEGVVIVIARREERGRFFVGRGVAHCWWVSLEGAIDKERS